ncbi:MAG: peptidoglycan DD-metalloendopeptidase family protein [Rhodospirillaceae bacterium]|nr:peptidoglycan DD-metalloendopeptidase family protein [Rhodospirillaceae bacterium]
MKPADPSVPLPDRIVIAALLVAALAAEAAIAQDGAAEAERLKTIERELQQGERAREKLFDDEAAVARELARIAAERIDIARDIQDQEHSLTVLENRLADLEARAAALTDRLGLREEQMGRVLMALQRLALRPADALTLSPLKPDEAVRTAVLLRAAVPGVRESAAVLQSELAELYEVRAAMSAQREQVAAGAAALLERRMQLAALEEQRKAERERLAAAATETTLKVEQLAREAADLRELLDKLTAERKRREAEAQRLAEQRRAKEEQRRRAEREAASTAAVPAPTVPPPANPPPPEVAPMNLAPLVAELRPFSQARGSMPLPAVGTVSGRYGEAAASDADAGLRTKGITILTRGAAQVVAPFDGIVAFTGPFRGYGLLLIIEHSEGYHTLLAGLGRIDCSVGQRVLAGEPVGAMDDGEKPSLYVELRRDGQPVNPLPWMAGRAATANR